MPPDCLDPAARTTAPATGDAPRAGSLPPWAAEPPEPPEGALVPGSRFHEEQWVMAAGMLARGASFLQVSRSIGCSRTTLWRAYYGSQAFRHRVWWERQSLTRESDLRLASLRGLVAEQVERLVSAGDPATVRWLADRLGMFAGDEVPDGRGRPHPSAAASAPASETGLAPAPVPASGAGSGTGQQPGPDAGPSRRPDFDDLDPPGALRERVPPDPRMVAAILARPEAEGPKGVFPWTALPEGEFHPDLGSARERRGGRRAFSYPGLARLGGGEP
ncbi:hypothetical protein [Azospirillum picis]|uniref:Homeodomain-like domain-containing protein n=1 Tax=Azospirillum picis TaxID=488438 RepID=A0ABU0MR90_9PROT|nr:hypothetical protein [Azospirillum picis]MBP2302073.1 hypothetical protein [Azospirillum picis]MDQ0535636.1 hypothetical protein [Azospirillum picis]